MANVTIGDLSVTADNISWGDLIHLGDAEKVTARRLLAPGKGALSAADFTAGEITLTNSFSNGADGESLVISIINLTGFMGRAIKTAPETLPYRVTGRIRHRSAGHDHHRAGLFIMDGSTDKMAAMEFGASTSGHFLEVNLWNASQSYASTIFSKGITRHKFPEWFRIDVTLTTVTFYFSWDGTEWFEMTSTALSNAGTGTRWGLSTRYSSTSGWGIYAVFDCLTVEAL